jgi:hypothetical protein
MPPQRKQWPWGAIAAGALAYVCAATVAPPLAQSEAEMAEIAANPCASTSFWALVPKMEAICGDGSICVRRPPPNPTAHVQDIHEKAAEGIRTLDLLHGKQTL